MFIDTDEHVGESNGWINVVVIQVLLVVIAESSFIQFRYIEAPGQVLYFLDQALLDNEIIARILLKVLNGKALHFFFHILYMPIQPMHRCTGAQLSAAILTC